MLRSFRRILSLNNAVLEKMAEMERALGGDYIFDRRFIEQATGEIIDLVREIVYHLNALSGDSYPGLWDACETIAARLDSLAGGGPGPYDRSLVVPYEHLHRDLDGIAGAKNAVLGEIRNDLHLRAPDGFAVTAAAYNRFMEENGLFKGIEGALAAGGTEAEREERIAGLFAAARVTGDLADAVAGELERLVRRCGRGLRLAVRSSAVGEDAGRHSFAGQFTSVLDVEPKAAAVLEAYRRVAASRFSPGAIAYLGATAGVRDVPMAVGVQEYIPARAAGVAYTRDPGKPGADEILIMAVRGPGEALVGGAAPADRYRVGRGHPFALRQSSIVPTDPGDPGPAGQGREGFRRGSAVLTPPELRRLGELALLLEKALGGAQDIEWALDGEPAILQSRPLHLPETPTPLPAEIAATLDGIVPLLDGRGETAQLGAAAGRVVHVGPETDPETFPVGAVAVARLPSPALSPVVWRAGAVITDAGGPACHLATIAREYRTPALFGTGEGSRLLAEGAEVTVDAGARRVYPGIVAALVRLNETEREVHLDSEEARTLRRLLRWIAPLNLVDPASPEFLPEGCRTFHDILRFSHEKAVETLIRLHEAPGRHGDAPSRLLDAPIPIRIRIIDLGGGLGGEGGGEVSPEQVTSRPLRSLLAGLLKESAWDREAAPLGLRDVLSGMTRPLATAAGAPGYTGENLAIAAPDYCNLSLRLGYHFNVVDTYLAERPDDNYVYFRFVGGIADRVKRARRARLIATILGGLHFKVERTGDLLVAKAKMLDAPRQEFVLARLGELIAFTRQLDVQLRDEGKIEEFFRRFLDGVRRAPEGTGGAGA